MYIAAKGARIKYNNNIKPLLELPLSPTQDPTSDKSQGGGVLIPAPPPPSEYVHAVNGFKFTFRTFLLSPHIGFVKSEVYVISKM